MSGMALADGLRAVMAELLAEVGGSQVTLAAAMKVSQPKISMWL